ncbi:hypothetical protein [Martelella sp. HB161492]|uniref:hypothetical protein n=1 Tax=Martelella sp. HB161492 TaxID=2720726 RepID=UPI0015913FC8|nr:hypothetical protein [Martelella sp. HB161492]
MNATLEYFRRAEIGRFYPASESIVDWNSMAYAVAEAEARASQASTDEERAYYRERSEVFGFALECYSNFDAVDALNIWPKDILRRRPAAKAAETPVDGAEHGVCSRETCQSTQPSARLADPVHGSASVSGVARGQDTRKRPADLSGKALGPRPKSRPAPMLSLVPVQRRRSI